MDAIVISLATAEQAKMLYPQLVSNFEQVAHYRLGHRVSVGPVHIAEVRLKRLHPECLLRGAVLLVLTPSADLTDTMDALFSLVARLDDPTGAKVQACSLREPAVKRRAGNAGS